MSRSKMPWRKLLTDPPSDWQRLPLLTRGVGDEVLRALDSDGEIQCGAEPAAAVVCRLVAAHPRERRRVAEALDELVTAGFLTVGGGVIRGRFPDLAARPKPAPSEPEADPKLTRSEREADVKPTRSQPEVEPNGMKPLTSAPVDKRREEEIREEREQIGSSGARAPEMPFAVEPEPSQRPSQEPRAIATRLYQAAYEQARAIPWMQANAFRAELDAIGMWAEAAGRREGKATEAVLLEVFKHAFADDWMRANGYPLKAIAKQVGELYKPPPKAATGPKPAPNSFLLQELRQQIGEANSSGRKDTAQKVKALNDQIAAEYANPTGIADEPERPRFARR